MSDESNARDDRGLIAALVDDGRPLLVLTAMALLASGAFAVFLAVRREFLPHDVAFLGMTAAELCAIAECRIVGFMFHDRVAFGGTLIAIAILYLWLALFPLRQRLAWAWWSFVASGVLGFGSFLAYLSYGYLDSWHGAATLFLLPVFVGGLVLTRPLAGSRRDGMADERGRTSRLERDARRPLGAAGHRRRHCPGRARDPVSRFDGSVCRGGPGIHGCHARRARHRERPALVPLIAHDRAGFGGGLGTIGVLLLACAWYARPSRSFHHAVIAAGGAGFGCAIGTHFLEGYTNPFHLAPAFAGAGLFAVSAILQWRGRR